MKRILASIAVLAILGIGIAVWAHARSSAKDSSGDVQTVRVERGTVALTVSADGVVKPLTTVSVKSYAGGRVDVLAVDVGDVVHKGDLIAKIDPTESYTSYEQARADLTKAQADLSQAREQAKAQLTLTQASITQAGADLARAQAQLRQASKQATAQPALTQASIAQAEAAYQAALKDLQRLREASHPQDRAQARAALDKAVANLDVAEKGLARAQRLKSQGYVAQSDVDSALNQRDLAKAELASAQERWDTLTQEQAADLEAAQAKVAQAQAALDAARANAVQDELRKGELEAAQATVLQAQAGLDKARADAAQDEVKRASMIGAQAGVTRAQVGEESARTVLGYTTITAPRDGVILQKYVEEGTIVTSGRSSVTQGTDIVLLGDISRMFVEVSLDEADAGSVRVGQATEISVDAFSNESLRGKVTRIDPQAVTEQNITTILVTVEIENPDPRLKPGMTASCTFLVDRVDDTLYLPSRAVQQSSNGNFVIVPKGKETITVPVEIGLVGDDRTEILEGLNEGAEVVLPSLVGGSQQSSGQTPPSGPPPPPGGVGSFFRGGG
jgi:HlyD family secretion protein